MPPAPRSRRSLLAGLCLALAATMPATAQQAPAATLSTEAEIAAEFASVPCDNSARLDATRALFERMGAPADAIRIDHHDDVDNLVVVKPGTSTEILVVGAHYDKVAKGCGAIDNWTGVVALAHLYRTLRQFAPAKTLVFVAFGREEHGLVGSRAMTSAIPDDRVASYCAMVNLDSLGLAAPQVADNMSSKAMVAFAESVAKELQVPFGHARIGGANSDSTPFVKRGIPALTLHGLDSNGLRVLHSPRDQAERVNATSVYLGYRLALAMLARLDQAPCTAQRDD